MAWAWRSNLSRQGRNIISCEQEETSKILSDMQIYILGTIIVVRSSSRSCTRYSVFAGTKIHENSFKFLSRPCQLCLFFDRFLSFKPKVNYLLLPTLFVPEPTVSILSTFQPLKATCLTKTNSKVLENLVVWGHTLAGLSIKLWILELKVFQQPLFRKENQGSLRCCKGTSIEILSCILDMFHLRDTPHTWKSVSLEQSCCFFSCYMTAMTCTVLSLSMVPWLSKIGSFIQVCHVYIALEWDKLDSRSSW